jgi:hypothetical protein
MLPNQIKLLQGVSLQGTYPIQHLEPIGFFSSHVVDLAVGVVLLPLGS